MVKPGGLAFVLYSSCNTPGTVRRKRGHAFSLDHVLEMSEEPRVREMHIDINGMYVVGRVSEARRVPLDC